jgi:hypothetical protein
MRPIFHFEPRSHCLSPKHSAQRMPTGLKVRVRVPRRVESPYVQVSAWARRGAWAGAISARGFRSGGGYLSEKPSLGAEKPEVAL